MDVSSITPEREAALKKRIRELRERGTFTYADLLEAVWKGYAAGHYQVLEQTHKEKANQLKKPSSSTFSRWLSDAADLEKEWLVWLEQYLDAQHLTTDYDVKRGIISSASEHYVAHANAHYVGIKPETQASAEREAPGFYAVWVPSSVLPGAFVFGLATIKVVESGVMTIETRQEYRGAPVYFRGGYLERQMRELGWFESPNAQHPGADRRARPADSGLMGHTPAGEGDAQSDQQSALSTSREIAELLDLVTTQPVYSEVEKQWVLHCAKVGDEKTKKTLQDEVQQGPDPWRPLEKLKGKVSADLLEGLRTTLTGETLTWTKRLKGLKGRPEKRIDNADGYFYRIRGAFEAHLWDKQRVVYTRYDLPDFERDLGLITYMKGVCQTRFGGSRHIKPVIFQRLSHWNGQPLLSQEELLPLLDLYPADLLPLEVRAFFVKAAEGLQSSLQRSGSLIIEV